MRTKNKADILLAVVFLCFLIIAYLKHAWGPSFTTGLLGALFESALIGGIADWFAVTALFKKPLGFPYHTCIIPRNRVKIIDAITTSVASIFSIEELAGRVRQIKFSQHLIILLESPSGKHTVIETVQKLADKMLFDKRMDAAAQKIAEKCKEIMNSLMEQDNWSRRLSDWVESSEQMDRLIDYAAAQFIEHVDERVLLHFIRSYLMQIKTQKARSGISKLFLWVGEETGSFNMDELAEVMAHDLYTVLRNVKNGDNILRRSIKQKLVEAIHDISKSEVVEAIELPHFFRQLFNAVLTGVQNRELLTTQLECITRYLKSDTELIIKLECFMQDMLIKFIESEHYLIKEMAHEALNALDDQRLADIVYEKAGQDLNWIRINGSVVGGIIGVILYSFTYFVKI